MAIKEDVDMPSEAPPSAPITHYNPYEMSPHHHQMASPELTQVVPHSPWGQIQFQSSMPDNEGQRFQPMSLPSNGPMLASPMDTISEVDYMSPLSHSFPRDDHPFMQQNQTIMFENYHAHSPPVNPSPVTAMMIEQPRPPTGCPSLVYGTSEPSSSSLHSHSHSHLENYGAQLDHKLMQDCDGLRE
jgi:hypothetical protein